MSVRQADIFTNDGMLVPVRTSVDLRRRNDDIN